jgi:hypothetical protein
VQTQGEVTDGRLAESLVKRTPLVLFVAAGASAAWLEDLALMRSAQAGRYICGVWQPELEERFAHQIDVVDLGIPDDGGGTVEV